MAVTVPPQNRVFLFLQGPHGPFFKQLARQLRATGAETWRVGFNAGDAAFWAPRDRYIPFHGQPDDWPETLISIVAKHNVTDVVLYGDARPIHAQAIKAARAQGLHVHVFEEGYLRPYWVTYERDGANGHSRLMDVSVADMRHLLAEPSYDPPVPPSHWGDMREHMFYGAAYHWWLLARNRTYPNFRPHRDLAVAAEFKLYLKKLVFMPWHGLERRIATWRIRRGTFPYHLALLQLEHDSSFQAHGPFARQSDFLEHVIEAFAQGAPVHHHLVFKAHPLEDGRAPLRTDIRRFSKQHGVCHRVHFVRGGKLAHLLDAARSATTVNSTAAQQALWRGLPVRAFGQAVYSKPELVSHQPLEQFFTMPERPNTDAYRVFRDFLLATSQMPGSYYAQSGRNPLLRSLPDKMLWSEDPYALGKRQNAAVKQQLRLVN